MGYPDCTPEHSALEGDDSGQVLLEARNIRKVFPGIVALDDVDLKLSAGRVHCAIGENGAGKSTLVKIITGGLKADGGAVYIRSEEAAGIFLFG